MSLAMSPEIFKRFQEMIYAKAGLEFPESKKYLLECRLKPRVTAVHCKSFEEYYHYLRFDPARDKELVELFNAVTTNETFFFRDSAQIECFQKFILPQIVEERKQSKKVRVWSAGCSSGEEAFTLAMVIAEYAPPLVNWDIEIMGTDISEHILTMARRGVYGPYSIRNIPKAYLNKYFHSEEGRFTVVPSLKKMVRFENVNLMDSLKMRTFRDMDLIFCRNVLIYFDQEARKKIISNFYDSLRDNGMFVIGFSESLNGINRLFHPFPWNKTLLYRKAGMVGAVSTASTPMTNRPSRLMGMGQHSSVPLSSMKSSGEKPIPVPSTALGKGSSAKTPFPTRGSLSNSLKGSK